MPSQSPQILKAVQNKLLDSGHFGNPQTDNNGRVLITARGYIDYLASTPAAMIIKGIEHSDWSATSYRKEFTLSFEVLIYQELNSIQSTILGNGFIDSSGLLDLAVEIQQLLINDKGLNVLGISQSDIDSLQVNYADLGEIFLINYANILNADAPPKEAFAVPVLFEAKYFND